MTSEFANLRYERKFLGQGLSLAEVVAVVRRHPALFRQVYPPRSINNIYLDSLTLHDYFDHVKGTANRLKTRIRWYGPLNGHVEAPTLERKIKRGLVGGKSAHPLSGFTLNGRIARHALDEAIRIAELPETLRLALRCLQPTLVNRYQRQYWLSACGRFRLTVDWDLQFFASETGTISAIRPCRRAPAVILELKFDSQHAEDAAAVTNALPLRLARCSKYVLGIDSIGAP